MRCPHCQGRLPAHRPVSDPKRYRIYGHHGWMELDSERFKALLDNAEAFVAHRRKITGALETLQIYKEIVSRLESDPAFARHIFSYDGDGGGRFFPGAARAAELAGMKARGREGKAREGDLLRYIQLMMDS